MDLPTDGSALAPNNVFAGTAFSRAFSVTAGLAGGSGAAAAGVCAAAIRPATARIPTAMKGSPDRDAIRVRMLPI